MLDSRKFDPWLRVPDNFISGRTEAYKNMALARAKDSIRSHVERIECVSDAFELIGKYIRVPITDIQTETPESPPADDGVSPDIVSGMPPSEPGPLANGSGGSPAPTEAEQAILDRLLKPGEAAGFESGLDLPDEYQCYLAANGNGNGGPVDPPGGPPPGGPEKAPKITNEEIARAAFDTNPKARAVAVPTTAAGFSVQVIFWRKDLGRD